MASINVFLGITLAIVKIFCFRKIVFMPRLDITGGFGLEIP